MKLQLNVENICKSDAFSNSDALKKVAALQRRRLSPLAKMALSSFLPIIGKEPVDYIVWVSHFGDEEKTLLILEDILLGEKPSPSLFSTSVHNAISGMYSIICKDNTPSTALSTSYLFGLIDAYSYLKTHQKNKAAIIYYDSPVQNIYDDLEYFEPCAYTCIVSLENPNIECDFTKGMPIKSHHVLEDLYDYLNTSELKCSNLEIWSQC